MPQAALKKFAKSAGPFERKLTGLYTKATLIPEDLGTEFRSVVQLTCSDVTHRFLFWLLLPHRPTSIPSRYLLCLSEEGTSKDEKLASAQRVRCHMVSTRHVFTESSLFD